MAESLNNGRAQEIFQKYNDDLKNDGAKGGIAVEVPSPPSPPEFKPNELETRRQGLVTGGTRNEREQKLLARKLASAEEQVASIRKQLMDMRGRDNQEAADEIEKYVNSALERMKNALNLEAAQLIAKQVMEKYPLKDTRTVPSRSAGIYKIDAYSLRDGTKVTTAIFTNRHGGYEVSVVKSTPKNWKDKLRNFVNGEKVLLIPMLGFGLAAALTGVVALNDLPFGKLASSRPVEFQAMQANASQNLFINCREAAAQAGNLIQQGNPLGHEVVEFLMSGSSSCGGILSRSDFSF